MRPFYKKGISRRALIALLVMGIALPAAAQVLDAQPKQAQHTAHMAVLYFRLSGTPYLAAEVREVISSGTVSFEQAAAQALVSGPGPMSDSLGPLFPAGTQVLSVQPEGDLLFVTFNEALLNRYADEGTLAAPGDQTQARLRRRLAMASLVNTLTERGEFRRVQVLVRAETTVRDSMRLAATYYLEESAALPDPLTRDEERIATPAVMAGLTLSAWQQRDWRTLYDFTRDLRPSQAEMTAAFDASLKLAAFSVTPGTTAPDGTSAVVTATLELEAAGGTMFTLPGFPLVLVRRDGIWRPQYESLLRLAKVRP